MPKFSSENPMRVLAILPTPPDLPPLAWTRQIGKLSALYGISVTVVTGEDAVINSITRYLRAPAAPYDVVLWSGHGTADGLLDSNGYLVSGQALATQLHGRAPYCAIVAACYSAAHSLVSLQSVAEEISMVGVHAIGFPLAVGDNTAIVYSQEFLRAIASGANVTEANRMALRVLRAETGHIPQVVVIPGLIDGISIVIRRLDEHGRRLDNIETTLQQIAQKIN